MARAFVLMTAMPPTEGHRALIQFAQGVAEYVYVIVITQPSEPYAAERVEAIQAAFPDNVVHNIHKTLPQDPEGGGFWPMWAGFLTDFGFTAGDFIVASELYGARLAEEVKGTFIPFDIERRLVHTKATDIRENTVDNFDQILTEFRPYLQKTVTFFGAESVGKTTMTEEIAHWFGGMNVFEYARPYLELVGGEVTPEKMRNIFRGQRALQGFARASTPGPFIFQDTDLYSTIGYWDLVYPLRPVSAGWVRDALALRSDLYVILGSGIPFEPDPRRYGGDVRESDDQYWIDVCERYGLPYIYIEETDFVERYKLVRNAIQAIAPRIDYQRKNN